MVTASKDAAPWPANPTLGDIRCEAREIRRGWTMSQRHHRALEAQRLQHDLWASIESIARQVRAQVGAR